MTIHLHNPQQMPMPMLQNLLLPMLLHQLLLLHPSRNPNLPLHPSPSLPQ